MLLSAEFSSIDEWGPGVSVGFFWALSLLITIPFALAVRGHFVARARAKAAAKLEEQAQPVAPGPALLKGVVETDDEGPAVRITITETGREYSNKGNYSHDWTEVSRQVSVQPFRLRLADETAILVKPDERIRLVDKLRTESFEIDTRTRVAELSHGEEAFVRGVLSMSGGETGKLGAYRAGPADAVVAGTRLEPLEVATGALEARFLYWRRFQGFAALLLGGVFLLTHLLVLGKIEAEWLFGEVVSAEYVRSRIYTTSGKNGVVTHYVVEARAPERYPGELLSAEVERSVYDELKGGEIHQVPFLVVPWAPWLHSIGTHPTQNILFGVCGLVVNAFALIAYSVAASNAAPWYEQRKVKEHGTGRLAERAYYVQVPGAPGLHVRPEDADNDVLKRPEPNRKQKKSSG